MPLSPFFAARLSLLEGIDSWREAFADPLLKARLEKFGERPVAWRVPTGITIQIVELDGPHGKFEVRLYTPPQAPRGGLLWMHGGGWSQGTLDQPEAHVVSAELAARAGTIVASVGYHLVTDELKYPAPLDDVVLAWRWLLAQRPVLGMDGPLAIGGASAGASLAMGATMRIRDEGDEMPAEMLLAYPIVHFPVPASPAAESAALAALPALMRFEPARVAEMQRYYVGRLTDLPVYATPAHGDLSGLPRTRLIIAEYDDLKPSGDLLAVQLAEAGVDVQNRPAAGMLHGHLSWEPGDHLPEVGSSLDFFAGFAKDQATTSLPRL